MKEASSEGNEIKKAIHKNIERILKSYNLGEFNSISEIGGSFVNYNFNLRTDKGNFIMQVIGSPKFSNYMKNKLNLEFKVLLYLKEKNFPYETPVPIKNARGKILSKIRKRRFWIYKKIEGQVPNRLNKKKLIEMGKAMSIYHKYVRGIKGKKGTEFLHSKWYLSKFKALEKVKQKNERDRFMLNNLNFFVDIFKHVISLDYEQERIITHDDFHRGNVVFRGNRLIGIIDFNNLNWSPAMMDLAIAVERECMIKERLDKTRMNILLSEYEKFNKLSKKQKESILYLILRDKCTVFRWFYEGFEKHPEKKLKYMKETVNKTKNLLKNLPNWEGKPQSLKYLLHIKKYATKRHQGMVI